MALYPEVQKKTQAEIDAVVGSNCLPDFHDRPFFCRILMLLLKNRRIGFGFASWYLFFLSFCFYHRFLLLPS